MTTVSETPEYKVLFFKDAAEADAVSSAAGANGFSLMTPDNTELVSLPDTKWSDVDTTWIPDLTTAPTEVFSDDYGMYINVGRVTFDGEYWGLYDPLTYLVPGYRVDNNNVRLMRWPPEAPEDEYDADHPPPKFLPPAFDYQGTVKAIVTGSELPLLIDDGTGGGTYVRDNAPRPRIQEPVPFTGQDAYYTYRDYVQACRNYCRVVYTEDYTNVQLLNTARSYLGKEAMTYHLHDAKRQAKHTWDSWDLMMKNRWLDPNLRANAMALLARKRHNEDESIHDYTLSFDSICNDAEIDLEEILPSTIAMFLNSLQDDLRTSMLVKCNQEELEKMSWDDICKLAHAQSHALGKYGARKKQRRDGRRNDNDGQARGQQPRGSQQQRDQQSQAHGKGRNRRRNGRNGNGKGKGKGRKGDRRRNSNNYQNADANSSYSSGNNSNLRPARNQSEREQYMSEGRCFDCGQTGHMRGAPNCPARTRDNYSQADISALADRLTVSVFDRLGDQAPAVQGNAAGTSQTDGQMLATSSQPQPSANRSLVLSPSSRGTRRS